MKEFISVASLIKFDILAKQFFNTDTRIALGVSLNKIECIKGTLTLIRFSLVVDKH